MPTDSLDGEHATTNAATVATNIVMTPNRASSYFEPRLTDTIIAVAAGNQMRITT